MIQNKSKIDLITLSSHEKNFELRFTHQATAIEGNTLTLMEQYAVHGDLALFADFGSELGKNRLGEYRIYYN